MSMTFKDGDMFEAGVEALVNTVNCVGVMGKGVALEFKRRWPENFKAYKKACESKTLRPGRMFVYQLGDLLKSGNQTKYIINFPTKNHWKEKSKIKYIEDGLDDFVSIIRHKNIRSVALPPLGCGNGGLVWDDVKLLIEEKLAPVEGVDFFVYNPRRDNQSPEFKDVPVKMTFERALLVKALGELEKYFGGYHTRISLQKIVYFLQDMKVNYNVKFLRNARGPYSEQLKDIFYAMEQKNFITGYSDDEKEIRVTPSALAKADEFLGKNSKENYEDIIYRLALLIEGYENPYGMELLSSVHYLAKFEGLDSVDDIVQAIQVWNDHKSNAFSPDAIRMAFERLKEDKFL